jgi:hypothetical protein
MTEKAPEPEVELAKDLDRMHTLRDEVRVRLHLASMDAKDEWRKLERQLAGVEKSAGVVTQTSRELVNKALERLVAFRQLLK